MKTTKDQVESMRSWALSRIYQCRVEETKFSRPHKGRAIGADAISDTPVRAQAERTALEAVLRQLGIDCKHVFGTFERLSDFDAQIWRCTVCGVPKPNQMEHSEDYAL